MSALPRPGGVTRHSSLVHSSLVTRHSSLVTRHSSLVNSSTRHSSLVTRHSSTRPLVHSSLVTRHSSLVNSSLVNSSTRQLVNSSTRQLVNSSLVTRHSSTRPLVTLHSSTRPLVHSFACRLHSSLVACRLARGGVTRRLARASLVAWRERHSSLGARRSASGFSTRCRITASACARAIWAREATAGEQRAGLQPPPPLPRTKKLLCAVWGRCGARGVGGLGGGCLVSVGGGRQKVDSKPAVVAGRVLAEPPGRRGALRALRVFGGRDARRGRRAHERCREDGREGVERMLVPRGVREHLGGCLVLARQGCGI